MPLWCAKDPKGKLIWQTIFNDRSVCVESLFEFMPESFRIAHWKDLKSTRRDYKKLGYKFVRVYLSEYHDE